MIRFDEALAAVTARAFHPRSEVLSITESAGRTLAEDVVAMLPCPPFDTSAMDGYALAGDDGPWALVGESAAGSRPLQIEAGEAIRIFTGAPLPRGATAVIAQEDAMVAGTCVSGGAVTGRHIRLRGEVFEAGYVLARAGQSVDPPTLSALISTGVKSVAVNALPRVGLLTTGNELAEVGNDLGPGQIYDSNGPSLRLALEQMGAIVSAVRCDDTPARTQEAITQLAADNDLLVTVGGVSVGDHDVVPAAAASAGFETIFHRVAMKPGKPIAFGVRPDGKSWLGLPGNPMSALVGIALFFPAWRGRPPQFFPRVLSKPITRTPGREEFLPAFESGSSVNATVPPGSHATNGLVGANGLIRVDADCDTIGAGEPVMFTPFPWRRDAR